MQYEVDLMRLFLFRGYYYASMSVHIFSLVRIRLFISGSITLSYSPCQFFNVIMVEGVVEEEMSVIWMPLHQVGKLGSEQWGKFLKIICFWSLTLKAQPCHVFMSNDFPDAVINSVKISCVEVYFRANLLLLLDPL